MARPQGRSCGSRKISVERSRGRYTDGGEVELDTWATFASEDLLRQVVVEPMLAGVATRRHVEVAEPVGQVAGTAVSKSAVSRRWVAATASAMAEMLKADLSGLETAVLMIEGVNVAGEMIVVAVVIAADGTKVPVGLLLGDTENTVVVKDLLADLVDRGLSVHGEGMGCCVGSVERRGGAIMRVYERSYLATYATSTVHFASSRLAIQVLISSMERCKPERRHSVQSLVRLSGSRELRRDVRGPRRDLRGSCCVVVG